MRSTNNLATFQTGFGITRSRAQNLKTSSQPTENQNNAPTGENRPFDAWFDYLRLVMPIDGRDTVQEIVDWLMNHLRDTGAWTDKACTRDHHPWDNEFIAVGGTKVHYWLPREGEPGRMAITLTGDVIETVEHHRFLWVCRTLWHDYKARATRVDIKLDDLKRQLCLSTVHEMNQGKRWCRFRKGKPFVDYIDDATVLTGFEYGSRESEVYARIYDKYIESKYKQDWIRIEFEYKGLTADHIFSELMRIYENSKHLRNASQGISALMASNCFSERFGLLFREHTRREDGSIDHRNRNRNPILPYWQQFMDKVLGFFVTTNLEIEPKVLRPKPALERCINFLQRSVANAYSAVREAYGREYAESLVSKGFEQLSRTHKAMVAKTRMETLQLIDKTTQMVQYAQQSGLCEE